MEQRGRLPWPVPAELDPERRAVYDKIVGGPRSSGPRIMQLTDPDGRLEGPFNAMLVNPAVGDALQELGSAVRYRSLLTDRQREIAILTVARRRRSDFEWYAHERAGKAAGLTADEIDAVKSDRTAATFSSDEAMVRTVTTRLLDDRDVADHLYDQAVTELGVDKLADLGILTGYYDLLSLLLRMWRTPLPSGVPAAFD